MFLLDLKEEFTVLRRLIRNLISPRLRPIILMRTYCIYAIDLPENCWSCLSDDFSFFFISNADQYRAAIEAGFDFSVYPKNENIQEALKAGASLLCVFKEDSLAHTTWLAPDHSRAVYDSLFLVGGIGGTGDAFIGPCNTYLPYRGRGIYPAALTLACQYLNSRGAKRAYINTRISNIASIRGIEKACFKRVGKAWTWYFLGKRYRFNNLNN